MSIKKKSEESEELYEWIKKVIKSCKTIYHFLSVDKLLKRYHKHPLYDMWYHHSLIELYFKHYEKTFN